MNDSFRTDIFLRYSPENIVCACIYLSANESQISLPQSPPWFAIFGANEETIKEICVRILHLYSHQTVSLLFFCIVIYRKDTYYCFFLKRPQEELEKIVNECREQLTEEKRRARETTTVNLPSKFTGYDLLEFSLFSLMLNYFCLLKLKLQTK